MVEGKKNIKSDHTLWLPLLLLVSLTISSWFALFPISSTFFTIFRFIFTPVLAPPTLGLTSTPTPAPAPALGNTSSSLNSRQTGPYHNWQLFATDFEEMMRTLKIYVYPDAYNYKEAFSGIFLPHSISNLYDRKAGNYFSKHMFKVCLLNSSLITTNPQHAHLFFMPFSINDMRNEPQIRSGSSIADFVSQYTARISNQFPFWNASAGADHFYAFCHSVG